MYNMAHQAFSSIKKRIAMREITRYCTATKYRKVEGDWSEIEKITKAKRSSAYIK
jgi:hypothetical protein